MEGGGTKVPLLAPTDSYAMYLYYRNETYGRRTVEERNTGNGLKENSLSKGNRKITGS